MKIPILLITHDRPYLLGKVLNRILKYTDWHKFDLWILDNNSTPSTKKILAAYKETFKYIKIYSSNINQVAHIQNNIINKLRSDFYIKLDDDIFVSEGWTDGFIGVYERNNEKMSFGSVIIPVNGFGWIPFMEIMDFKDEFISEFPDEKLIQDCMNTPIWQNEKVVEFFWNKTLDIDQTAKIFKERQNNKYRDLICNHRYSIGAIVFSHKIWEKMGGWKASKSFYKRLFIYNFAEKLTHITARLFNKEKLNRIDSIIKTFLRMDKSELGVDEKSIFEYSRQNKLIIPVTTQSIVFHYSFGQTDEYISKKILLKIK